MISVENLCLMLDQSSLEAAAKKINQIQCEFVQICANCAKNCAKFVIRMENNDKGKKSRKPKRKREKMDKNPEE